MELEEDVFHLVEDHLLGATVVKLVHMLSSEDKAFYLALGLKSHPSTR